MKKTELKQRLKEDLKSYFNDRENFEDIEQSFKVYTGETLTDRGRAVLGHVKIEYENYLYNNEWLISKAKREYFINRALKYAILYNKRK